MLSRSQDADMDAWERKESGEYAGGVPTVEPFLMVVGLVPLVGLLVGAGSYLGAALTMGGIGTGVWQQAKRTGDAIVVVQCVYFVALAAMNFL